MSAPLNLINRFELLLTNSPTSLPRVLDQFAMRNIAPAAVNAVSQSGNNLVVTVIVKHMGEETARLMQKRLKTVPVVKSSRLEHIASPFEK